ncbi:two pore channel protein 1-like [Saccoglossus kowalevskii]
MDNNNTGYFGGVANGVISTDVNTNYVHHVPVENRIDGGDSSEPGPSDICIRDRIVTYDTDTQAVDIDVVAADDRTIKTPITELDIFLAGILVTDAINARHGYFKHGENELRLYYLYHHWILRWIIYFFIAIILSLALFEYPAATDVMLPYWSTMMLELVCIAAFIGRLVHSKLFTSGVIWWSDWKNLTVIIAIALTFVDMVLYIVFTENGIYMVRWSRLFRPLYLINITHNRQMRRAFRNIRRTLPDICVVLILYLLLVALFALMALKMFENRNLKHRSGEPYMSDYWDNYYALYIYVTTANSPDVMMPAYDHNYWFCLFFIAYLIICYYIFMSVILAVIYNNYRKHLKTEVKKSVFQRRRLLSKAFNILKVKINGCFVCTMGHFQAIMKHVCPKASPDRINLLWNVLDELDNKYIKKKEFLKLYDLLNVPLLEEKDQKTFLERTVPSFYLSRPSLFIQRMVVHKAFHWVFDALIIINAVFIAFSIEESEWFFLTIFSIEIFLKLYTMGHKEFFRRAWNM